MDIQNSNKVNDPFKPTFYVGKYKSYVTYTMNDVQFRFFYPSDRGVDKFLDDSYYGIDLRKGEHESAAMMLKLYVNTFSQREIDDIIAYYISNFVANIQRKENKSNE